MILLALVALCLPPDPCVEDPPGALAGHWAGAIVREGAVLPIELDLSADGSEAWLDVPTWGLYAQPLPPRYVAPDLTLPFGRARIQLRADAEAGALVGQLVTGSQPAEEGAIRVELTRVLAPDRPAVRIEEVRFRSADGVELAGVLALPEGDGPFPGLVLVQGRSYGTRDQFRSHAILAARRGIAGLAFDGRGTGGSGGVAGEHTLANRLDDAQAALELLRSRPEVDRERVGMLGHSSGGWVVPIVAQRSPPVAFLVLHSGPAEPLGDQQGHVFQEIARRRSGLELTDDERAGILDFYRGLVELAAAEAPWSEIEPRVEAARATRWGEHVALPAGLDDVNLAYYRRNPHDSTEALRATRIPVLALYGSEDFVVPPAIDVPLLEEHLRAAGNEDHLILVLPGADHDLMIPEVEQGAYRWQRRPPGYFETILDWIAVHVPSR